MLYIRNKYLQNLQYICSRYAAILFRKQHYVSSQHRANMELLCKVRLVVDIMSSENLVIINDSIEYCSKHRVLFSSVHCVGDNGIK